MHDSFYFFCGEIITRLTIGLHSTPVNQSLAFTPQKPDMDTSDESLHIELPVTAGRRAMSVPAHMVGRRRLTSTGDPLPSARPMSRKLHTSPPLVRICVVICAFELELHFSKHKVVFVVYSFNSVL